MKGAAGVTLPYPLTFRALAFNLPSSFSTVNLGAGNVSSSPVTATSDVRGLELALAREHMEGELRGVGVVPMGGDRLVAVNGYVGKG